MKLTYISLILVLASLTQVIHAQTLPVGLLDNLEDAYRRQQLLGNDTSNSSYLIRPLTISGNPLSLGDNNNVYPVSGLKKWIYTDPGSKMKVYALPLVWQQQVNSHHPYGRNDGSMVQARGYQTQLSAGLFAELGPLTIQLRPEYVFAENKDFQKLSDAPNGVFWNTSIANYYNTIDLPDRYGDDAYSKLSLGQSSIRLNAGAFSFGLSNENLWWGPGINNSLLMSNNAPGFAHFTFNTTKPFKTPIGSFETQIIGGRLNQSGIPVPIGPEYKSRGKDWRYISGIVFTYQPKWMPNFFVGVDKTVVTNSNDMGSGLGDYLSIFKTVERSAPTSADAASNTPVSDQYISFFTRYVLPESKAEVYFEYGHNQKAYNTRDALVEPEHSRAYIVGFRKLIPLGRADEYIQMGVELTQMEKSKSKYLRESQSWYNHSNVLDGYTNKGQVLGAGIGPGSNLQSLDVSWVKGLKKIGLQFERLVNNNDLFYNFAYASLDKNEYINRHWVDLSIAGKFAWNYKQFVLNTQATYIRSLNYQYQWKTGSDYWDWDKQDVNNLQVKVGLMYIW